MTTEPRTPREDRTLGAAFADLRDRVLRLNSERDLQPVGAQAARLCEQHGICAELFENWTPSELTGDRATDEGGLFLEWWMIVDTLARRDPDRFVPDARDRVEVLSETEGVRVLMDTWAAESWETRRDNHAAALGLLMRDALRVWRRADWFSKRTDRALGAERLERARRDGRLPETAARKIKGRWYYDVAVVADVFSEYDHLLNPTGTRGESRPNPTRP